MPYIGMKRKSQKGEVATAITIGALLLLGAVSLVSSYILNKGRLKTKPRAEALSPVYFQPYSGPTDAPDYGRPYRYFFTQKDNKNLVCFQRYRPRDGKIDPASPWDAWEVKRYGSNCSSQKWDFLFGARQTTPELPPSYKGWRSLCRMTSYYAYCKAELESALNFDKRRPTSTATLTNTPTSTLTPVVQSPTKEVEHTSTPTLPMTFIPNYCNTYRPCPSPQVCYYPNPRNLNSGVCVTPALTPTLRPQGGVNITSTPIPSSTLIQTPTLIPTSSNTTPPPFVSHSPVSLTPTPTLFSDDSLANQCHSAEEFIQRYSDQRQYLSDGEIDILISFQHSNEKVLRFLSQNTVWVKGKISVELWRKETLFGVDWLNGDEHESGWANYSYYENNENNTSQVGLKVHVYRLPRIDCTSLVSPKLADNFYLKIKAFDGRIEKIFMLTPKETEKKMKNIEVKLDLNPLFFYEIINVEFDKNNPPNRYGNRYSVIVFSFPGLSIEKEVFYKGFNTNQWAMVGKEAFPTEEEVEKCLVSGECRNMFLLTKDIVDSVYSGIPLEYIGYLIKNPELSTRVYWVCKRLGPVYISLVELQPTNFTISCQSNPR